jgi:alpha-tubulin suppressor-like RCC1 family protein
VPTLVQGDLVGKRVVDAACSYFHTVVVTAEGELFTCGRNDFGQLGLGDGVDRSVPSRVVSLQGLLVRAVSCGQHHTVVAVAAGGLYAFGKNDHGQLGIGNESTSPVREPTRVSGDLETASVTSLACGYYHTVAVTEQGAVYAFGRNEYGQLGLGHKRHVSTPTVSMEMARRISHDSC